MDVIENYPLPDNRELKIFYDDNPESPRKWDNLGTMICAHRRYNLGDVQVSSKLEALQHMADHMDITKIIEDLDLTEEIYNDEDKLEDWLNSREDWVCLPLYLYDHSGITISTSSFSCRWDSGQVGHIFCSTSKILEEYGDVSPETLEKVSKVLEGEVEVYDQYITGDVYGFRVVKKSICDHGHEHEEDEDSCWGFFGSDIKENGILDYLSKQDSDFILKKNETTT